MRQKKNQKRSKDAKKPLPEIFLSEAEVRYYLKLHGVKWSNFVKAKRTFEVRDVENFVDSELLKQR